MIPVPAFGGRVEKGKLQLYNREKFLEYVATLDGDVLLSVKKRRRNRSDNQNRYYWGVVIEILAKDLGYHAEEMHDALKWKFLRKEERPELPTTYSTSMLSTAEMEEYLAGVRLWAAAELGIVIPLPNEVDLPEYG